MKTVLKYYDNDTGLPSDCGDPLVIEQSSRNLGWNGILVEKGYSPYFFPKNVITPYFYFALAVETNFTWNVEVDNETINLKSSPGDVWTNPPNKPFTHEVNESCCFIILAIDLNTMLQSFTEKLPSEKIDFLRDYNVNDEVLENLINLFYLEVISNGNNGEIYLQTLLKLFSNYFIKNYSNISSLTDRENNILSIEESKLQLVYDFINTNINTKIRIEDLSDLLNLTKFQFLNRFRYTTGITPYQYILKVKMEKAEQLLTKTSLPLTRIAYDLGFSDQSHFNKCFKRFFGYTPGKLR